MSRDEELREKLLEVVRGIASGPFHRPVEAILKVMREHEEGEV